MMEFHGNSLELHTYIVKFNELNVGIYACSPMDSTFDVVFDSYLLEKSKW